jgi:hypothetical protein
MMENHMSFTDNVTILPTAKMRHRFIYPSRQAAYDDMMRVAVEVIQAIKAAGGELPSVEKMSSDLDRLWKNEWEHLAPSGR